LVLVQAEAFLNGTATATIVTAFAITQ